MTMRSLLEAREAISRAYHCIDEYTMPQTAPHDEKLLDQALKEIRSAGAILNKIVLDETMSEV